MKKCLLFSLSLLISFASTNIFPVEEKASNETIERLKKTSEERDERERKLIYGKENEKETGNSSGVIDDDLAEEALKSAPYKIKNVLNRLTVEGIPDEKRPHFVLLVGESGVGKTTLAIAMAKKTGRNYAFFSAKELLNRYLYGSCEVIQEKVGSVIAQDKPYVIVIDEVNFLSHRYNDKNTQDRETAMALWGLIDECANKSSITIIGTANDLKDLPPQLKTRSDKNIIEVPLPDSDNRKKIILFHLTKSNVAKSFETVTNDASYIKSLVEKTNNLSPREIVQLIDDAYGYAIDRLAEKKDTELIVRKDDFERAFKNDTKQYVEPGFDWEKVGKRAGDFALHVTGDIFVRIVSEAISRKVFGTSIPHNNEEVSKSSK